MTPGRAPPIRGVIPFVELLGVAPRTLTPGRAPPTRGVKLLGAVLEAMPPLAYSLTAPPFLKAIGAESAPIPLPGDRPMSIFLRGETIFSDILLSMAFLRARLAMVSFWRLLRLIIILLL